MSQKTIEINGVKKLQIYVSVSCPDHPAGRIQIKRVFDNIVEGSTKANSLEKDLMREVERERAKREHSGLSWETLLSLYEMHVRDMFEKNQWCQSKQTYNEAIRALHNWTKNWYKEPAGLIAASDVTMLFHQMKEQKCSDSFIAKVRGDIRKVFTFGILYRHVRGIKDSPTNGVTIKSRRRMRTEILRDDEIKKLLSYAKQYEPVWYYIWAFAIYTGCRNGELYALKWSDINFQGRLITVQRSYNKKYRQEKGTKTEEWRSVSICEPLWEILQELKLRHDHLLAPDIPWTDFTRRL